MMKGGAKMARVRDPWTPTRRLIRGYSDSMTISEASDRMHCHRHTLSSWLKSPGDIRLDDLRRLGKLYKIPPDEMVEVIGSALRT